MTRALAPQSHSRHPQERLTREENEKSAQSAPAIAELLRSGCPFMPYNARSLLPIGASLVQEQEIDLCLFQSGRMWDWRGHEAMVHLALQE
jgi:hypothetical protein